jgi:hypothetical protein
MAVDDFLVGLNQLSPAVSLETSPVNGPADPTLRSAFDLSHPADPATVAAQLDLWTSVNFDFDSPLASGPPPSFDRAFDHRPGGLLGDDEVGYKAVFDALPTTIAPDLTLAGPSSTPWDLSAARQDPPILPVASLSGSASGSHAGRDTGTSTAALADLGGHTTGVGTPSVADQEDDAANRRAIEEDKRRRNTLASGTLAPDLRVQPMLT